MFLRFSKRKLLSMALIGLSISINASELSSLPIKVVNGVSYHSYIVKQHETIYALSKRFGIAEAELFRLNPEARNGLKTGQEILLPSSGKTGESKSGDTYVVKKQETAYGISKRFGLSLEEFFALNPSARDGVQEGQTVRIGRQAKTPSTEKKNVEAKQPSKPAAASGRHHTIAEHETLYQIARSNNISLAQLLQANPSLDAAHYSAGTTIIIPPAAETPAEPVHQTTPSTEPTATPADKANLYTVKTGDTFYSIASRHGLDVGHLRQANPGIEILKEGMTLALPQACAENESPASASTPIAPKEITIAVVLPFQADQKAKHNKNMVEFYRGFLLAVDSMRNIGQPIRILTYDTNATDEGLSAILGNPDLKKAMAIVAPDNADHIARLNEFGQANGINVLNVFNNRDTAFMANPYAMQAAIPREMMYDRAAKSFVESFADYTPVFLINNDGRKDKVEFIDVIREQLRNAGRDYKELKFNGTLTPEFLSANLDTSKKYAFLPGSSNREEFEKIASPVKAYKDTRDFQSDVIVWGYPEWLANRSAFPKMHELDCYIYSRNDYPETFTTEQVNNGYAKWFGPNMLSNYPRRAYMGFDTGMFLIKSLSVNGGDFSKYSPYTSGLTMPVTLRRSPKGGWFNNELLMINLAPGEVMSKRTI